MLFQNTIESIDSEITALLAQIEAKKQRQSQLIELDSLTDSTLEGLANVVSKIGHYAPDAIVQLKSAVLNLFSDDGGNDGGNQPTAPTPEPEDDGLELLCLNGLTGECLTTTDLDEGVANIGSNESQSLEDDKVEADANAVPCVVCGADLNDEANYPKYATAALSGICRSCEAQALEAERAAQTGEDADNETTAKLTYAQAIKNRCSACWGYEVKSKGDIKSGLVNRTDLNFMEAVNLERTGKEFYEVVENYLDRLYYTGQSVEWACPLASPFACPIDPIPQPLPSSTEMIHTSARTGYLKLRESGQILAAYAWFARKNIAEAWASEIEVIPTVKTEIRESKRNSSWKWELKITGLSMNQIERLALETLHQKPSKQKQTLAQEMGLEPPNGWRQPHQTEVQVTPETPKKARITLESSPYNGHICDVVEANDNWWTLATPKGNLKYPADSVEPVDDAVPMTENREEAEAIAFEFGDIAEVTADLNGTHLIGSFGKVKFIKDGRVAVEIDEQLVYFQPQELKLRSKAEPTSGEQQQLPTGQVLLGNRIATSGNYFGAARRAAVANARRGTANKLAALELVKAGLAPELAMAAATGSDDASDF